MSLLLQLPFHVTVCSGTTATIYSLPCPCTTLYRNNYADLHVLEDQKMSYFQNPTVTLSTDFLLVITDSKIQ